MAPVDVALDPWKMTREVFLTLGMLFRGPRKRVWRMAVIAANV